MFPLPSLRTIDVNDKNQMLFHTEKDDKNLIRVMDRHRGNIAQEILPQCNHTFVCLSKHPTDPRFVLEGCVDCEVIRNYSIHTGQCETVYTSIRPVRMFLGPAGSILVLFFKGNDLLAPMDLVRLNWQNGQEVLRPAHTLEIEKRLVGMSYVERHDILVYVCENERVEAVRLDKEKSALWGLSGVVGGLPVKPNSITSDTDGNAYVADGRNNRILKIDSFTGVVINVLQLGEESQMQIRSLFWSKNEPSLTVVRGDKISTHHIP